MESTNSESTNEKVADFSTYYGKLQSQANMLSDHIRTSTYQQSMLQNLPDFKDKVVLDVGTGSGRVLLFFPKFLSLLTVLYFSKDSLLSLLPKLEQNESMLSKQAK